MSRKEELLEELKEIEEIEKMNEEINKLIYRPKEVKDNE